MPAKSAHASAMDALAGRVEKMDQIDAASLADLLKASQELVEKTQRALRDAEQQRIDDDLLLPFMPGQTGEVPVEMNDLVRDAYMQGYLAQMSKTGQADAGASFQTARSTFDHGASFETANSSFHGADMHRFLDEMAGYPSAMEGNRHLPYHHQHQQADWYKHQTSHDDMSDSSSNMLPSHNSSFSRQQAGAFSEGENISAFVGDMVREIKETVAYPPGLEPPTGQKKQDKKEEQENGNASKSTRATNSASSDDDSDSDSDDEGPSALDSILNAHKEIFSMGVKQKKKLDEEAKKAREAAKDPAKAEAKVEEKESSSAEKSKKKEKVNKKALKREICTFWQRGTCERGDACTYAHGSGDLGQKIEDPEPVVTCKFWLQGKCKQGADCKWAHFLTKGAGELECSIATPSSAGGSPVPTSAGTQNKQLPPVHLGGIAQQQSGSFNSTQNSSYNAASFNSQQSQRLHGSYDQASYDHAAYQQYHGHQQPNYHGRNGSPTQRRGNVMARR